MIKVIRAAVFILAYVLGGIALQGLGLKHPAYFSFYGFIMGCLWVTANYVDIKKAD